MRCPECGGSRLRLGVVLTGEVSCEFQAGGIPEVIETSPLDSHWDDDSSCHCLNCTWTGRVRDLLDRIPDKNAPRPHLPDAELEAIERSVLTGDCPPQIRDDVKRLTALIRDLHKQVRILETVARANTRGRGRGGQDTEVL